MWLVTVESKPDSIDIVNFVALQVMLSEIFVFTVGFYNMLLVVDSADVTASRNVTGQNIRPPLKSALSWKKIILTCPGMLWISHSSKLTLYF